MEILKSFSKLLCEAELSSVTEEDMLKCITTDINLYGDFEDIQYVIKCRYDRDEGHYVEVLSGSKNTLGQIKQFLSDKGLKIKVIDDTYKTE